MTSVSGSERSSGCGLGRSGRGWRARGGGAGGGLGAGGVAALGDVAGGGVARGGVARGGVAARGVSGSGAACRLGTSGELAPVTFAIRSATVTPSVWLLEAGGGSFSSGSPADPRSHGAAGRGGSGDRVSHSLAPS